ncbi:MAG TPA: 5-formyltetrahydrofolate cyclo-ligase [Corynebacterium sp.]|nr:5-formyltetrahydrofolate cyclo-ligase [Corynebacterium sp.]
MVALTKQDIRHAHTQARKGLDPAHKAVKDAAITRAVAARAQGLKVSAYFPLSSEPGGTDFIDKLYDAASEVWLPLSGKDGALTWSLYEGPESLRPGALGIAEPTGTPHSSSVLASLDVLFIPALAIDHQGMRLGKGAGYYDRALASLQPRPQTIAIVYAEEVIDFVPHDEHDQAVDLVITD